MAGATKLMTAGGGGVNITPASSIASDVTVNVPSQNCTLGIQGPAFSAYPSGSQNIANLTATKLTFDTESFDTNNNFSASRFTPTVAGVYQISAAAGSTGTATGYGALQLYKNGVFFQQFAYCTVSSTYLVPCGSCLVQMNGTTDYIEVYALNQVGGTITYGAGPNYTYFQGALVRAA